MWIFLSVTSHYFVSWAFWRLQCSSFGEDNCLECVFENMIWATRKSLQSACQLGSTNETKVCMEHCEQTWLGWWWIIQTVEINFNWFFTWLNSEGYNQEIVPFPATPPLKHTLQDQSFSTLLRILRRFKAFQLILDTKKKNQV